MTTTFLKQLWLDIASSANEGIKELAFHVRSYIILRIEAFKLKLAMRLSDIKQRAKNKRFHVVLMEVGVNKHGDPIRRLRSIDNTGFDYCRKKGWLPKKMSYLELEKLAFYSTPISLNNSYSKEDRAEAIEKYMKYQKVINKIKL
jgi:hypothetical protein